MLGFDLLHPAGLWIFSAYNRPQPLNRRLGLIRRYIRQIGKPRRLKNPPDSGSLLVGLFGRNPAGKDMIFPLLQVLPQGNPGGNQPTGQQIPLGQFVPQTGR
ncbi:MAG TPA: hypothetical protein PK054_03110 [Anaerohalosphaeraceae bacterium]|nr:hypothetical protein [Anaerohalosphaeraceae bacterium]HPP55549.1 hypothetical protein [Anaerohalosphaeraceae bacterium]